MSAILAAHCQVTTDASPQIASAKTVAQFDPNEADVDKTNPFHGILALMLQNKNGFQQNAIQVSRGPGRPSLVEAAVDEIETEEQVKLRRTSDSREPSQHESLFFLFVNRFKHAT